MKLFVQLTGQLNHIVNAAAEKSILMSCLQLRNAGETITILELLDLQQQLK